MSNIAHNILHVQDNINGFPQQVKILAVSKGQSAFPIQEAYESGIRRMGENYLQEALQKKQLLTHLPIEWYFIGAIQRNKAGLIAKNFDWVLSIDNLYVAEKLSASRPSDMPPLQVCVQVNMSGEEQKSGTTMESLPTLLQDIQQLPRLRLRGLMMIPSIISSQEADRSIFQKFQQLFSNMKEKGFALDVLSMGMTHDYQIAIQYGANLVRIGTGIFGSRPSKT